MARERRITCALLALVIVAAPASAHEILNGPPPLPQPSSPVQLKSCYLGTDFWFTDPKLASEVTKLQLGADLAKPVPAQYQLLGLRFEFGLGAGRRSSDIVMFTGTQTSNDRDIMAAPVGLDASGYLPRVADYDDYRCAVDFTTSLDRSKSWYDVDSDVVPCATAAPSAPISTSSPVWLDALELGREENDAIFYKNAKDRNGVYWQVDGGEARFAQADSFGRSIVSLGKLQGSLHELEYGATAREIDQRVCFRAFKP